MASKTKPRTKPKPTKTLKSWSVLANGQQVIVVAEDVSIDHTLIFETHGEIVHAFGPGAWSTITLDDPPPDQD
jgi:hypothetical protein